MPASCSMCLNMRCTIIDRFIAAAWFTIVTAAANIRSSVEHLTHSASFPLPVNNAPSKPGIKHRLFRGSKAANTIVVPVEAAVNLSFDEGLAQERALFEELRSSTESRALCHVFFAERTAGKVPDLSKDQAVLPVRSVGVIGAGTMGSGIATLSAQATVAAVAEGLGLSPERD